MRDFRVISAKTLLPIYGVAPVRGFLPPSVVIVGDDLNKANEIEYNGCTVSEFIVSAPNRIVAKIPEAQVNKALASIRVYAPAVKVTGSALITTKLTSPSKTVSGIDRLVQSFLLVFMSTPGTDLFDPDSAGGGMSIIGRSAGGDGKTAAADLALAVERTKAVLLASQAKQTSLPLSETLLSCALDSVEFDQSTTTLNARVILQNRLGESAEVSLG